MKNKFIHIIFPFFVFFFTGTINAQITKISGVVSDDSGKPLTGVKIATVEGKNTARSGKEGQYILEIEDQSNAVIFSMTGYQSQVATPESEEELNIALRRAETYNLDETVYSGNSTQRKGNVTGAMATVSGELLEHAPAPNLSQTFAGRLAGLFAVEAISEQSAVLTQSWIRGFSTIRANQPLIFVDGFPYPYDDRTALDIITAMEVESISILKDASTQALYGVYGADGVIVITTRRGVQGKLRVDVKVDQTFEQTSTRMPFLGSGEYVPLRNQAGFNDGYGRYNFFSKEEEEKFISGENRELYPSNDWRKMFMKDFTNMQRVGMNITGGNGRAAFFTNLNVMHEDGIWITDQTKYDPNNNFLRANIRSNVDIKINKFLSAALNLNGNIQRNKNSGLKSGWGFANDIYSKLYTIPSYMYGPVTPPETDPNTGELLHEGGGVVVTATEEYPPYAAINRLGYIQGTSTNIFAQFALKLDMDFLTKGLDLSGYMGYRTHSDNVLKTQQDFASWIRTGGYDELKFSPFGTKIDTPLNYSKDVSSYYNLTFKGIMNYRRSFGEHHITGMAFALYQINNPSLEAILPYKCILSGVSAAYDYNHRYLVKFDLGYSGSEQYYREHRFTALPAVSAGWVLSNESFMEQVDWLSFMKLRASYGKAATCRSDLGRYVYLDNITLNSSAGMFGGLGYLVTEGQVANPLIQPEIALKQNYGIELTFLNNIAVSADIFTEKTDNMVSGGVSIIPSYQGIPLNYYPRINSGIFENKGYEISVDYSKAINSELSFNIGGWLAYTKNKVIYDDESELDEDYAYRKKTEGFSVHQQFGYIVDESNGNGFFNSQEELDNNSLVYETGTLRLGDLKYIDLNNDGIINEKDWAPLGHGSIPRYTYAFHANARFKNFDLAVLFQGVADIYSIDMATGRVEYTGDGIYTEWHKNAWTAERYANGDKITYPALSTKENSNHKSNSFFLEDKSYLRLKNLTIGYTFPQKVSNAIVADRIRLYVSGQNIFTWHHLTTKEYAPEGNHLKLPVFRLYNVGLSVKF